MDNDLVLLKLGGSVISFKDKPLTHNMEAIDNLVKELLKIKKKFIIIHGGGSFGHYWSVKYNMHTKHDKYSPRGIAIVHESMIHLNQIIVNSFLKHKFNPYSINPSGLLKEGKPISDKIKELDTMTENKVTPITFGDVIHIRNGNYSILSGDSLMRILSKILRPKHIIFALNIDGLYNNLEEKKLIHEIDYKNAKNNLHFLNNKNDVTGGMARKVSESLEIVHLGLEVKMINGLRPKEISKAINKKKFIGTIFKSSKLGEK